MAVQKQKGGIKMPEEQLSLFNEPIDQPLDTRYERRIRIPREAYERYGNLNDATFYCHYDVCEGCRREKEAFCSAKHCEIEMRRDLNL